MPMDEPAHEHIPLTTPRHVLNTISRLSAETEWSLDEL